MKGVPNSPVGRIYDVAEAAKMLGMGRRSLEALLLEFPYYTPNGNRKLFNDDDIKRLWRVRRVKIPTTKVERHSSALDVTSIVDPCASLRKMHLKDKLDRLEQKVRRGNQVMPKSIEFLKLHKRWPVK